MTEKAGALAGMGMTEKQGGSDVRANTTRAEPAVGYGEADVDDLVNGAMQQQRLLATAPLQVRAEDLAGILRRSLTLW